MNYSLNMNEGTKTEKVKFTRGYSRTFGNNIWNGGMFEIVREGSSYWGFTGYTIRVGSREIGRTETLSEAKAFANNFKG